MYPCFSRRFVLRRELTAPPEHVIQREHREPSHGYALLAFGSFARYLNRYIPFLGAHLGDICKLSQEFNPANLATAQGRARYATVGMRAMAYITLSSISLYLLQHNDEDYQEIPEYLKANAWVIIDKDNGPIPFKLRSGKQVHVWLIPRPYMLGYLFGYMPEKILAGVKDKDPKVFADMVRWIAANVRRKERVEDLRRFPIG